MEPNEIGATTNGRPVHEGTAFAHDTTSRDGSVQAIASGGVPVQPNVRVGPIDHSRARPLESGDSSYERWPPAVFVERPCPAGQAALRRIPSRCRSPLSVAVPDR